MPDDYLGDAIRHTRLRGESETYLAKREELRLAEIESMKLRDGVAELRRQLPHGAVGRTTPLPKVRPSWTLATRPFAPCG